MKLIIPDGYTDIAIDQREYTFYKYTKTGNFTISILDDTHAFVLGRRVGVNEEESLLFETPISKAIDVNVPVFLMAKLLKELEKFSASDRCFLNKVFRVLQRGHKQDLVPSETIYILNNCILGSKRFTDDHQPKLQALRITPHDLQLVQYAHDVTSEILMYCISHELKVGIASTECLSDTGREDDFKSVMTTMYDLIGGA